MKFNWGGCTGVDWKVEIFIINKVAFEILKLIHLLIPFGLRQIVQQPMPAFVAIDIHTLIAKL